MVCIDSCQTTLIFIRVDPNLCESFIWIESVLCSVLVGMVYFNSPDMFKVANTSELTFTPALRNYRLV
jgi:hypothetical protein